MVFSVRCSEEVYSAVPNREVLFCAVGCSVWSELQYSAFSEMQYIAFSEVQCIAYSEVKYSDFSEVQYIACREIQYSLSSVHHENCLP